MRFCCGPFYRSMSAGQVGFLDSGLATFSRLRFNASKHPQVHGLNGGDRCRYLNIALTKLTTRVTVFSSALI
jgi:hypothetical protein